MGAGSGAAPGPVEQTRVRSAAERRLRVEEMMRASFKAVVFDLDDTLFDCTGSLVDASRRRAAQALLDAGLPMTVEDAVSLQRELADSYGPYFQVFDEIGRRYGLDDDALAAAFRAYNSEEVGEIEPFPDVLPTLRMLRRQGILCLLLTVGQHRRQANKLKRLGLAGEFDEVLVNDMDRGALMSECLRYFLQKYGLHPNEALIVGDRPGAEIRVGNELGMTTAQMMHGRFRLTEPRDQFETADYRISHIFQVPTILRLNDVGRAPDILRIVAVGGGTGLPIVLSGCKAYCRNLTAVVNVTDSGRSSGRLRDELQMLAPGDARNCLVALSEPGERERLVNQLYQYRFKAGSLEGMSLGNLIIAAMTDMAGSFEQGIKTVSRLLNIRGKVLPSTVTDCHVCAELEDGTVVEREVNVRGLKKPRIRRVFLKPDAPDALDETIDDIMAADIIALGPGSLFTSVIPNILVPKVRQAVRASKATKVYVCNAMTQPGQTDGFTASDHFNALSRHLGDNVVDAMLMNSAVPDDAALERYRQEGAEVVAEDPGLADLNVRILRTDLVEDIDPERVLWEKKNLLRHHPDKLGDALCRLYADVELYGQ